MQADNAVQWSANDRGFYEVWYLKVNFDLDQGKSSPALWLRFSTLSQQRGIKAVAEVWAIYFEAQSGTKVDKIAIKNSFPLKILRTTTDGAIHIDDNFIGPDRTKGSIRGRGNSISWNLEFHPNVRTFFHVPPILRALTGAKADVCTPNIDIRLMGSVEVNGKRYNLKNAAGCQGHIWGKRYPIQWAWAHCNAFDNSDAAFEALCTRVHLGGLLRSPQLSSIMLQYKGKSYQFNRLSDSLFIHNTVSLVNWTFSVQRGPLRLRGEIKCNLKDMATVTYEDPEGGFMYCNNTELASANIGVYFNGKLDASLKSANTMAFETVSRKRSPYLEVLL